MKALNKKKIIKNYLDGKLNKPFEIEGITEDKEFTICRLTKDCLEFKTSNYDGWFRIDVYYKDGRKEEVYISE